MTKAMTMLSKDPKTLFVGQSCRYDGQAPFKTLGDVPMDQRIEFPVAENLQLGFCTGLALAGYLPVCIFPRMDFLILAMDALVNHLDKISTFSEFNPKVIIRTSVGSTHPVNPGPQHCQNHIGALRQMLTKIRVVEITQEHSIETTYEYAMKAKHSVIIIDHMGRR